MTDGGHGRNRQCLGATGWVGPEKATLRRVGLGVASAPEYRYDSLAFQAVWLGEPPGRSTSPFEMLHLAAASTEALYLVAAVDGEAATTWMPIASGSRLGADVEEVFLLEAWYSRRLALPCDSGRQAARRGCPSVMAAG